MKAEQALKASGVNAGTLKANPAAAVAGLASLKAALTAQEIKLANMRAYLTESAPAFKQALNELTVLQAQLKKAQEQEQSTGTKEEPKDGLTDYIARFRDFKYY